MPSDQRRVTSSPPARRQVIALLAFALVVRGGFLLFAHQNLQADPDGYLRLANNLVDQGTLGDQVPVIRQRDHGGWQVQREFRPTAYRPPLFPIILATLLQIGVRQTICIALLHLALGLLTVWLTVSVGVQLGLGRESLLAGALVACDPILLQQSSFIMTETLATLCSVAVIGCLIRCTDCNATGALISLRTRFATAGGVLALAALCRPTFLLMLPLAGAWLWYQYPLSSGRIKAAAAYLGLTVLVLAPWVIRNTVVFGKPVVATTHGGYTFHLANNPGFYHYLQAAPAGSVWKSTDNFRLHAESNLTLNMTNYPDLRLPDLAANPDDSEIKLPADGQQFELVLDKLHYADAMSAIADEPAMFVYSIAARLGRLWQPLPHRASVPNDLQTEVDTAPAGTVSSPESLRSWLARYLVAVWYVGLYVLAVLGLWKLKSKLLSSPWCWGTLLVLSLMALHAFYWTDLRMRAPLVPVVCLWAAAGWNCYRPDTPRS